MSPFSVSRHPVSTSVAALSPPPLTELPKELLTLIFFQVICNSQSLMLTCTTFHQIFKENTALKNLTSFYKKLNSCYLDRKTSKHAEPRDPTECSNLAVELKCIKALAQIDRLSAERVALQMENSVEKVSALAWLLSSHEGLTTERRCVMVQQGLMACQTTDDSIRSLHAKTSLIIPCLPFYPEAALMLKTHVFTVLREKKRSAGHLMALLPLVKKLASLFPKDAIELAFSFQNEITALKSNQTRTRLLTMIAVIAAEQEPDKSVALLKQAVKATNQCLPGAKIVGLVDMAMEVASLHPAIAQTCLQSSLDLVFEHKKLITDTLVINIAKTAALLGKKEGGDILERTVAAAQTFLSDFQKARAFIKLSRLIDQVKGKALIIEAEALAKTIQRQWRAKFEILITKVYILKDPMKGIESAERAIEAAATLPDSLKFPLLAEVAEALSFTHPARCMQVLDMIDPPLMRVEAISLSIYKLKKRVSQIHFQEKPSKKIY
ncbi:hypothetical protein [Estrella lausannensis]|uniref:Uncharacterized protein n=1 Tax=Estrella lausannensis TaxID=483423 RepID=A0A0H5DNF0_9BACT|nr:hypothetical protein [Estrella lausannensis]CRX37717.1 hypothetical protein ELAC_0356 [Estrella lausannensis]